VSASPLSVEERIGRGGAGLTIGPVAVGSLLAFPESLMSSVARRTQVGRAEWRDVFRDHRARSIDYWALMIWDFERAPASTNAVAYDREVSRQTLDLAKADRVATRGHIMLQRLLMAMTDRSGRSINTSRRGMLKIKAGLTGPVCEACRLAHPSSFSSASRVLAGSITWVETRIP
jgi:hypothetical protein